MKILDEKGLEKKKFFGGDEIGLTDIAFGWIAGWLGAMEEAVGVKLLDPDSFPRLQAWVENFKEVPVIKESLPDHNEFVGLLHTPEGYVYCISYFIDTYLLNGVSSVNRHLPSASSLVEICDSTFCYV